MIYRHDFGRKPATEFRSKHHHSPGSLTKTATLLIGFSASVGLAEAFAPENRITCMTVRQFMALPAPAFDRLEPGLVLSPLIADSHDALEVAERLRDFGYNGKYNAIVHALPDASLVSREIASIAPQLEFSVTEIGALA